MRTGAILAPMVRIYQVLLFLVAKPTAVILDGWVGREGPRFLRERDLEIILEQHIRERDSEIGTTEGRGALNFLDLDDRRIETEGASIDPASIFALPSKLDLPLVPEAHEPGGESFVAALMKVEYKWAILTDEGGEPRLVLDIDAYLRDARSGRQEVDPYRHCHRPIVVSDPEVTLDEVLGEFIVEAEDRDDLVIDRDVILYWSGETKRIVTGADVLGRLLRGIAQRTEPS